MFLSGTKPKLERNQNFGLQVWAKQGDGKKMMRLLNMHSGDKYALSGCTKLIKHKNG
jgi:uncharacterized Rmd1/YagE family protein